MIFFMKTIEEKHASSIRNLIDVLYVSHSNPLIKDLSILTLPEYPCCKLKRQWLRDILLN